MKRYWKYTIKLLKGWRLGDYFRQFSIVAAGVIVTFWGSDLITNHSRQKEIRSVMQLIHQELQNNHKELLHIRSMIKADIYMSRLLKEAHLELDSIPSDTIKKYWEFFSTTTSLNINTDALEVLKGSQLMQHISDKQMLQDLLQIYAQLDQAKTDVAAYYQLKNHAIMSCMEALDQNQVKYYMFSEVYDAFYDFEMTQPVFLSFVSVAEGFCDWSRFNHIDTLLTQEIALLHERFN